MGYDYAIGTSKITKFSYLIKYLLTHDKNIKDLIRNENEVIRYLKKMKKKI